MQGGFDLVTAPLPTFSHDSDNFALAIHIFQLLMNGTHPFACAVKGSQSSVTAPQPLDNILRGDFPFIMNSSSINIPLYSPKINILTNTLKELFKRAFIDGHTLPSARPTPMEWHNALGELRQNLMKCSKLSHHQYYKLLPSCPWCEIDGKFKPQFTPLPLPPTQAPQYIPPQIITPPPPTSKKPAKSKSHPIRDIAITSCVIVFLFIAVPYIIPNMTRFLKSFTDIYQNSQNSQAISQSSSGFDTNIVQAMDYFDQGNIYFDVKKYDEAIIEYTKAIELAPNFTTAYYYRGTTNHEIGRYANAIEDYSKAIELDPNDEYIYFDRGLTYDMIGSYTSSIEDYTKAIELDPYSAHAYNKRGSAFGMIGYYDRAINDYSRAIELNSDYADAYNNRGITYHHINDYIRAIADYETALRIDPSFDAPRHNLAQAIRAYAPTDLKLKSSNADSITIQWDSMDPNIKYNIYWSIRNNITTSMYLDYTYNNYISFVKISGNVLYYFWVSAVRDGIESEKSDVLELLL